MNKTTNYQLNQWAKSDQVKMEDFNADNAKIDAAIAVVRQLALRSRFTKLKEFVSTENSSFLQIYLNDIDWAQWDKVHVDILAAQGGNYFFYNTDADSASNNLGYIRCSHIKDCWAPRMTFHVGFHADRMMDVSCGIERQVFSMSYVQAVKMAFSGAVMSRGAKYVFWGEK